MVNCLPLQWLKNKQVIDLASLSFPLKVTVPRIYTLRSMGHSPSGLITQTEFPSDKSGKVTCFVVASKNENHLYQ